MEDLQQTYADLISGKIDHKKAQQRLPAQVMKEATPVAKQGAPSGSQNAKRKTVTADPLVNECSEPAKSEKIKDEIKHANRRFNSGNDAAQEAARIKAKHPEVAAAVERGEFPSMHAAALAAGIVRQRIQIDAEDPESPLRLAAQGDREETKVRSEP